LNYLPKGIIPFGLLPFGVDHLPLMESFRSTSL